MEKELLEYVRYGIWILFGSGFIFEISPIKFNPISSLLSWTGKKLNKDVKEDIKQLKDEVKTVQLDLQDHKVESWRRDILDFADKLMRGEKKSKEGFEFIIRTHDNYEKYLKKHNIDNGQVTLAYRYIVDRYQECMKNNDFYYGK